MREGGSERVAVCALVCVYARRVCMRLVVCSCARSSCVRAPARTSVGACLSCILSGCGATECCFTFLCINYFI